MLLIPDCVFIVIASLFAALLTTFIEWFLVYSTDSYKELNQKLKDVNKKLEQAKKKPGKRGAEANIKHFEEKQSELQRDMQMGRFKSMIAVGISMFVIFRVLSSMYDGIAVAKLPFEPFSLLQNVSHRNVLGNDMTDCSFTFIYVLSSMSLRTNIQKLMGFQPQQQAPSFLQPSSSSSSS
eukprot:gb/GECH01013525.1/.p1 GENE.gb/GECH01013525.1/~~gb/GECH01013525.1/.p1  ORF type:complete len:180 (+),score=46.38 gb/GECH01013525.1/:1-540(+)